MQRKIERRWPIELLSNHRWPEAELRAMSDHLDRKTRGQSPFYRSLRSPVNGDSPQVASFNIAEQIVRDFRRTEGFNTYETAGAMRPLCRKVRRPFFLKRWFNAVNWDLFYNLGGKAIEWACIGIVTVCLIYLGILIFWPSIIWK